MKIRDILENFILVAIVLVIIHTFLFELSVYSLWSVKSRHILVITGFMFDLIFSIEFIVRTIAAGRGRPMLRYWFYERGWVDFISSLPLLILDSGPSTYILLTGSVVGAESELGALNVLKVVKAIRVTRILRLVRILKIFGKIHNTDSKMAQHHTSVISTIAVFTTVVVLIVFAFISDGSGMKEVTLRQHYYENMIGMIKNENTNRTAAKRFLLEYLPGDEHILKIYSRNAEIFSRVNEEEFRSRYGMEDFIRVSNHDIMLVVSITDIHRKVAMHHMQNFFVIIFVVLAVMFIYTRHFAQNISDIVHILNKGFRKKDYNLQIKIKEIYREHEIFRLARFYNDAYLPAKHRRLESEKNEKRSSISIDDLTGFNK